MGWELPPRGKALRVICCEMARISAHLLGVGVFAMDTGAMTVFLYTFTEREKIYNLTEQLTGARFTTSYTRIGGQIRDLPETFVPQLRQFLKEVIPVKINEIDGCSRATASSWIARATSASSRRNRPSPSASRGRTCAARASITTCARSTLTSTTRSTISTCPSARWAIATTVTSCAWRKCARASASSNRCSTTCPTGPINVVDGKNILPPKQAVLMKMEELIHHFILVTEGIDAPPGEVYFGAENPKGELGFYINSKGGGVPHRLKIRAPSFVNLSILPDDPARPHDQRRGGHPRQHGFRHGRVRPLNPQPTPPL